MDEMKEKLSALIKEEYKSESACAASMGWPRQRLNKIINAEKEPDVTEVAAIAIALSKPVELIANIFLLYWSPNGQQTAS